MTRPIGLLLIGAITWSVLDQQGVAQTSPARTPSQQPIRIVHHELLPEALAYWESLKEERPPLRGFRAPILGDADQRWPMSLPADASPTMQAATNAVAHNLARNGLLSTTAEVIGITDPNFFADGSPTSVDYLRFIGLPVDLMEFFKAPGQPEGTSTVATIAKAMAAGIAREALATWLNTFEFRFTQTRPGFAVFTECGEDELDMLRLQVTRGTYWQGPGDGGNVDMVRQLVEQLPDVKLVLSIQRQHLDEFLSTFRTWSSGDPQRITLVTEPLIVAQWAQDNGKPGVVMDAGHGARKVVTLVPRFASRGEDGSTFVPGETLLLDGLPLAGLDVAQSPLLFQGGDLLAVRDPKSGKRTLLIGEAELYRHTALGLSIPQTIEAFRIEFGVDQCVPMPAVSFHIDFEMTIRVKDDHLVAFVNDTPAAVRIILECGVDALEKNRIIDSTTARRAKKFLADWDGQAFLQSIFNTVMARSGGTGHFPESLANAFSAGPSDSGVGNFQRFLLAMDMLLSWSLPPGQAPPEAHAASYLQSFGRRDEHRHSLHAHLQQMGFEVVTIPSMGDAGRGINYINGIQDRSRYLMPTYGGLFAPLDVAAKKAFEQALGPGVTVIPILSGESQRRVGGLHCSTSAYYRLPNMGRVAP